MTDEEHRIAIVDERSVIRSVLLARKFAVSIGFDGNVLAMIATSVSELARNIVKYAERGELVMREVQRRDRPGIEIEARDNGPGIEDIAEAMTDSMSTGGTLGLGLPGVRRMMDEFEINSTPGGGTKVVVRKWR